jgi:hypothetical protein
MPPNENLPKWSPGKFYYFCILLLPVLVLVLWFVIKIFQFQILQADYRDGLLALQLSRGWLEGRPFLYDCYYGFHSKIHNYYFLPLTGLVTFFTGIYGFFILYLSLIAFLLAKIFFWTRTKTTQIPIQAWFVILIFLLGPVNYYIYLDHYGWHSEQYFLPLMGLSAFYIATRNWLWASIIILLTCLVKENAPVLICGLLLFISIIDLILKKPETTWQYVLFHIRNFIIVFLSLLLFLLGMVFLSYQNEAGASRLTQAIDHIKGQNSGAILLKYLSKTALFTVFVLMLGTLPFTSLLRNVPKKALIWITLTGYFFVLALVFFIEGLYYYPGFRLGMPYPTRTGGLWAFLFSCYLFLFLRLYQNVTHKSTIRWKLVAASFVSQLLFFPVMTSHNELTFKNVTDIRNNFIAFIQNKSWQDPDEHQLDLLAQKLPRGSEIITPDRYQFLFQNIYAYNWRDKNFVLDKPIAYVYEKKKVKTSGKYTFPTQGYHIQPNENLLILIDSTWHVNTSK